MIEDALRRRVFTVRQLERRVELWRGRGVAGVRTLEDLLRVRGTENTDSGWEVRLEQLLVAAGLPRPVRQLSIDTAIGRLRVDLGDRGPPGVAFEYDSDRWHSGVAGRRRDMERRNALRAVGVLVVEPNAALMADRGAVIHLVRELMVPSLAP